MIEIKELTTDAVCPTAAINRLLSELSLSPVKNPVTREEMKKMLDNPHFHLFLATERKLGANRPVGMATIYFQRIIARWIAEIHDVVLDKEYRGQGIGEALVERLLAEAEQYANTYHVPINVDLTSRPARVAGNMMYKKLGFILVAAATENGTNLYRKIVIPT